MVTNTVQPGFIGDPWILKLSVENVVLVNFSENPGSHSWEGEAESQSFSEQPWGAAVLEGG